MNVKLGHDPRARFSGALEVLGLLREKFELEAMEAADLSARETALDHVAAHAIEDDARPTEAERARMHTLVFAVTG